MNLVTAILSGLICLLGEILATASVLPQHLKSESCVLLYPPKLYISLKTAFLNF